jgi:YjbE family integral membrane protein
MLSALIVLLSVVFLDVILSGDNAVVIGMAANTLPQAERIRAIIFGMTLAAITRICLSLFAISLLHYRLISIIGGFGLFWVAYRLGNTIFHKDTKDQEPPKAGKDFLSTIGLIAIADVSMSLDNVLAVAGIARNNPIIMVIGLVLSIAFVGVASKIMADLLEKFKWLNWVGVGLIVMVATELIVGIKAL